MATNDDTMSSPLQDKIRQAEESTEEYKKLLKEASKFNINPHIATFYIGNKAEPFFAYWSRRTTKIPTLQIQTAGVTARDGDLVLYYNPGFCASLESNEIRGLLKHEFYHLVFSHLTTRKKENHKVWNIATDCAINSLVPYSELPKCGLIPGHLPIDNEGKEIISPLTQFVKNIQPKKASEWYYNKIINNEELVQHIEDNDGEAQFDEHIWDEGLSDDERQILKEKVKSMLNDAIKEADREGWGNTSTSIREMLRELASSQVDWKTLLKQVFGNVVSFKKRSSIKVINKRYPYIHPGRKKSRQAKARIYIDESGSISNNDIALFFGELKNLSKKTEFECYFFDHNVDEENKFIWKRNQGVPVLRTKRGGTNFDAVVEHFNRDVHSGATDASLLVILTDGECRQPRPCIRKMAYVIAPNRNMFFSPRENELVIKMKKAS